MTPHLTLDQLPIPPLPVAIGPDPRAMREAEWILTTGHGGFAMGTPLGVCRRKYHTLLNAPLTPPVDRIATVNRLDETFTLDPGTSHEVPLRLALHETRTTPDCTAAQHHFPDRFEKDATSITWIYEDLPSLRIEKQLRLGWRTNTAAVRYRIRTDRVCRVEIRPLVSLRDFHDTLEDAALKRWNISAHDDEALTIEAEQYALHLRARALIFEREPELISDLVYDIEASRDQPDTESLFSPGVFAADLVPGESECTIAFALAPDKPDLDLHTRDRKREHIDRITANFTRLHPEAAQLTPLVAAADDFLVMRSVEKSALMSVIAGYPWFADWGRDTMISLPGLMLATGRYEDARSTLETYARHVSKGMIPNRFDDYSGPPHYNTVDASLWFLHAVREYLRATDDRAGFGAPGSRHTIRAACHDIIEHYRKGTRFNIRMDPDDALIAAGDDTTQLTWMDAKRDGKVFTPRHGKAVEINALWHHGLLSIAECIHADEPDRAEEYRTLATRVAGHFRAAFADPKTGALHDCLRPDPSGRFIPTGELRPNQIFAASLEHSPLNQPARQAVVDVVRKFLLTPVGLRTLAPGSKNYQPRFEGDMMQRDNAYHNGTVWPWLIGPYCEAVLRAGDFSREARHEALDTLRTLFEHMRSGCLGQIAEVYDADEPRRQQGCTAQAWSVAEPLRIVIACLE